MQQGLFESLTGHFLDGKSVDSVLPQSRMITSIKDNLQRVFTARQGSMSHMPDYGLPDISEVYRKMPHGVELLQNAIKTVVDKYEPRLKNARIVRRDTEGDQFKLKFMISGEMAGIGLTRFEATFTSQGEVSVTSWKKSE